jgi:hypothetical protein
MRGADAGRDAVVGRDRVRQFDDLFTRQDLVTFGL